MIKLKNVIMVCALQVAALNLYAGVKVEKNINYTDKDDERRQLNVYYQKDKSVKKDVIVFIHGGSWSSGKKDIYWWLGRNMARKGTVTVNINYGLAPENQYPQMAEDCAMAVKWVQTHISEYGGNPERIFLMGHSAGAHLAELINSDGQYFKKAGIRNPVKGMILDDPFGLDMKEYMSTAEKDGSYTDFLRTFSNDPAEWEKGSPLHYVQHISNPHLIFYGGKTYPAIQIQSARLHQMLLAQRVKTELHCIKNKKHVAMIAQMIFGGNQLYKYITGFLKRN